MARAIVKVGVPSDVGVSAGLGLGLTLAVGPEPSGSHPFLKLSTAWESRLR